jgi:hypothetical protein
MEGGRRKKRLNSVDSNKDQVQKEKKTPTKVISSKGIFFN